MNTPAGPTGILLVDKSLRFTSMDVCAIIRSRLKRGGAPKRIKVGHGGTLDPLATGLLVVLVGKATRMCDAVMAGEKRYLADVDLSCNTPTDDAEGERTPCENQSDPGLAAVEAACRSFTGKVMQRPPAFSAMHVDGRRAYDLARKGHAVELPARPVDIHDISILSYEWPRLRIDVRCGKGVYIRSLARDLGAALGRAGMLAGLRRTAVGGFTIDAARTLDNLPDPLVQSDLLPLPVMQQDQTAGRSGPEMPTENDDQRDGGF